MSQDDPVIQWIERLGAGDQAAARMLWETYYQPLVQLARRKVDGLVRHMADEEDVALSAFNSFCRGINEGRFPSLDEPSGIWKLLVIITCRKAQAHRRYMMCQKRGGGAAATSPTWNAGDDSGAFSMDDVLGDEPTPEFAAIAAEEFSVLFDRLEDEQLKRIAIYKMEGYSNEEIAKLLDCVPRTIHRKLERIRAKWAPEAEP